MHIVRDVVGPERPHGERVRLSKEAHMKTMHILVADDEEAIRSVVSRALLRAGYLVTVAEDGAQALREIVAVRDTVKSVDLLLTDLEMPGITGLELIDQLNRNSIDIPTVAMSGGNKEELLPRLLSRGFSGYIEKPFELKEVVEEVRRVLNEQRTT